MNLMKSTEEQNGLRLDPKEERRGGGAPGATILTAGRWD